SEALLLETRGAGAVLLAFGPRTARLHLVSRERLDAAAPGTPFALKARAEIEGAQIVAVDAVPNERIAAVSFSTRDSAAGGLVLEGFGAHANAYLLGSSGEILAIARDRCARGLRIGEPYSAPVSRDPASNAAEPPPPRIEDGLPNPVSRAIESLADAE